MTMYADKALRCVSCGNEFTFSAREQEFHATKGFANDPRRCVGCRQARRATAPQAPPSGPSSGQQSGSGRAATHGDSRSYQSTCSACGGEAMLPFDPVGNRPVLCGGCYDKIRALA